MLLISGTTHRYVRTCLEVCYTYVCYTYVCHTYIRTRTYLSVQSEGQWFQSRMDVVFFFLVRQFYFFCWRHVCYQCENMYDDRDIVWAIEVNFIYLVHVYRVLLLLLLLLLLCVAILLLLL